MENCYCLLTLQHVQQVCKFATTVPVCFIIAHVGQHVCQHCYQGRCVLQALMFEITYLEVAYCMLQTYTLKVYSSFFDNVYIVQHHVVIWPLHSLYISFHFGFLVHEESMPL